MKWRIAKITRGMESVLCREKSKRARARAHTHTHTHTRTRTHSHTCSFCFRPGRGSTRRPSHEYSSTNRRMGSASSPSHLRFGVCVCVCARTRSPCASPRVFAHSCAQHNVCVERATGEDTITHAPICSTKVRVAPTVLPVAAAAASPAE